ncbi:hypothetical protein [Streptomyces sp. NBC_01198]|uniref:hypothetical protein n=1 Tax=Streptomyces sp. NBC_01198 TaxID=2903769 RepID=UPI002E135E80|nr:hypothetical protein OG702_20970 [Streptomyces sp. NBC_01198]
MHTRAATVAVALTAALLSVAACGPTTTDPKDSGASHTSAGTSAGRTTVKAVPDVVGKGLQAAQDAAQAAGFDDLSSDDSLGRARHQILDRDWKVCFQSPAAGTRTATATTLDFGAVKVAETCPKTDARPPAKAGRTMPDFVGKGLAAARGSLPDDASVTSKDALGKHRLVVVESNWKVCSQDPKAGARFTGQPVTFTAVKTGESCP